MRGNTSGPPARTGAAFAVSAALLMGAGASGAEETSVSLVRTDEIAERALVDVWRVGGASGSPDEGGLLGRVTDVARDGEGRTFVLDAQLEAIFAYDASGAFLREIGRAGEGPGEFQRPGGLAVLPDGRILVHQPIPPRIVLFTSGGDPAGEIPVPENTEAVRRFLSSVSAFGDRLLVHVRHTFARDGSMGDRERLVVVSYEGEPLTQIVDAPIAADPVRMIYEEAWFRWIVRGDVAGDVLVTSTRHDAYELDVWNPAGEKVRTLTARFEPLRRSDAALEELRSRMGMSINGREAEVRLQAHERTVTQIIGRPDGHVWIQTATATDDVAGRLGPFDVVDPSGRFAGRIRLTGDVDPASDVVFYAGEFVYAFRGARARGEADAAPETDASLVCFRVEDPRR